MFLSEWLDSSSINRPSSSECRANISLICYLLFPIVFHLDYAQAVGFGSPGVALNDTTK